MDKVNGTELIRTLPSPKIRRQPKKVLSFLQKHNVIEKHRLGLSISKLAIENGVSERTVYRIIKDTSAESYRLVNPLEATRKHLKFSAYPRVEKALKIWYYQQRGIKSAISLSQLQRKAKQFFDALHPNAEKPFLASVGFVQKFLSRNSISLNKNEDQIDNHDSHESVINEFDKFIAGSLDLTEEQIVDYVNHYEQEETMYIFYIYKREYYCHNRLNGSSSFFFHACKSYVSGVYAWKRSDRLFKRLRHKWLAFD